MKFEVLISSLGSTKNLKGLFESLDAQTILPEKIHIGIDKNLSKEDYDLLNYQIFKSIKNLQVRERVNLLTNFNSDFFHGRGVSRNRNYLIDKVNTEYLYFLDDDNEFGPNFFAKTLELYQSYHDELGKDYIFSPKIIYRKSGKSQSEGIKEFNFMLSKVVLNKIGDQKYSLVKMIGGNSLFGKTQIFKDIRYDEKFQFVFEDLDFAYRSYLSGYPILVTSELGINHMERTKTRLEHSFIGNPVSAYQKSRNRIWFVKKNGTKKQRFVFFALGLWLQTIWFLFLIILFGKNKLAIMKAVFSGIKDGLYL